jgi:hypothetical protein
MTISDGALGLNAINLVIVASLVSRVYSSLVSSRYDELRAYRELQHQLESIEIALINAKALLFERVDISSSGEDIGHVCERISQTLQAAFPPDFSGQHETQHLLDRIAHTCRSQETIVRVGEICNTLVES